MNKMDKLITHIVCGYTYACTHIHVRTYMRDSHMIHGIGPSPAQIRHNPTWLKLGLGYTLKFLKTVKLMGPILKQTLNRLYMARGFQLDESK